MHRERVTVTDDNLIFLLHFSWEKLVGDVDTPPMMVYIILLLTSRSSPIEKSVLL